MWRCTAVLMSSVLASGICEAAPALQSHIAVYEVTLERAREGAGIADLRGRLVLEWARDCEGYILNQRMLTQVTSAQGEDVTNDFIVTTWESLDGLKFRYSSRSDVGSESADEVAGKAELTRHGGTGEARFTKPQSSTLTLPEGAVFPTEQVMLLLGAAENGERTRSILLFDGSRADGLFETFNVIGAERPPLSASEVGQRKLLSGQRSWAMHTAYFPRQPSKDRPPGTPEFEIAYRLYQNGVANEIVFDYGHFAMRAMLTKLTSLPAPSC